MPARPKDDDGPSLPATSNVQAVGNVQGVGGGDHDLPAGSAEKGPASSEAGAAALRRLSSMAAVNWVLVGGGWGSGRAAWGRSPSKITHLGRGVTGVSGAQGRVTAVVLDDGTRPAADTCGRHRPTSEIWARVAPVPGDPSVCSGSGAHGRVAEPSR
ncbi:hypothetical protein HEK616_71590 [Streptomyces nigrescens]|uniref:Uncharacterized protein n=1 Tax=Streptomyces nigrescens TaxID=1920 RepID=A0ABM8A4X5_STRNI|nr:hypothetical protein HEK616_71590 [Streptomyces nigrescens]